MGYAVDVYHSFHDKGKRTWLDVKRKQRDEEAMEEGVKHTKVVLVIASESYFERPFCLKELGWAVKYNKPIVVVIPVNLKEGIVEMMLEAMETAKTLQRPAPHHSRCRSIG